jgi:DNA (cytosine-5)-methyltransferase 1
MKRGRYRKEPVLSRRRLTAIELCAGAGGQAIGLEAAGFEHVALVELDRWACATLRSNRPNWPVVHGDLREFSANGFENLTLVAGGVPCPPFSVAGKQLGELDDRDLFPAALDVVERALPEAVMLENVRGLLGKGFDDYRGQIIERLRSLGYWAEWQLLNASDFGVPQLRARAILVGLQDPIARHFQWPTPTGRGRTVGQTLREIMGSCGWDGADAWAEMADDIAPTIVGGSHKHGGPDLGPTRAKQEWAKLGVDGLQIADAPPPRGFRGVPQLTVEMAALIQGFPPNWRIKGRKTPAYRQVGNAFPPPVAEAVGRAIWEAIDRSRESSRTEVPDPHPSELSLWHTGEDASPSVLQPAPRTEKRDSQ